MYIQHLTLASGNVTRIERGDVYGETLARISPWLTAVALDGGPAPLPVSALAAYSASASVHDGALILTVLGPAGEGFAKPPPLVTIGVAKRSRHGAALWPLMTGPVMPPSAPGLKCPSAPWCAVVQWPPLAVDLDAADWLGDFERCVAWAWVTRAEG